MSTERAKRASTTCLTRSLILCATADSCFSVIMFTSLQPLRQTWASESALPSLPPHHSLLPHYCLVPTSYAAGSLIPVPAHTEAFRRLRPFYRALPNRPSG